MGQDIGFSKAQLDAMSHAMRPEMLALLGGAIRSGKTTAQVYGYALWLCKEGVGFEHALLGQSVESCMRNVGFPLMDAFDGLGAVATFSRTLGSRITVGFGGKTTNIWIVGASDERSRKRIQGATLKGGLVDEAPLVPEEAWNMFISRFSEVGAKVWATYNPEGPNHWFKKKVVDRPDEWQGRVCLFGLDDNPSLTDSVKDRYRSSFAGHWEQRYIQGIWAGASGLVWPHWTVTSDEPEGKACISLDWAWSGTFAALLHRGGVVVDELYHDGSLHGTRGEDEHRDALVAWALEHGAPRCTVWVDPATPVTFKRKLRKAGFALRSADNDVVPGIVTTGTRLQNEDIRVHERCEHLLEELGGYSWDEKKADLGEDAPVKMKDHCCDALRYFAHSTGKIYRNMGVVSTKEALGWH